MAVAGSLTYDTKINKNGFESGLDSLKASTVAVGNIMAEAFGKVAGAVKDAITTGVEYNAKIEQYNVGLKTLLGSAQQASDVMNQIQQDAKSTPFNVDNLIQAERLLISTGLSAGDSRKTILALGDAVSATGGGNDELGRMAVNLQQIKNVGQASALDIKQFAYAGIDIYGLVADYTGKSREEVSKMTISYDVLSGALQKASGEGGKYYNAMNDQSKTLNGQLSNLEDGFNTLMGSALKPVNDFLKDTLMPNVNDFIAKLQERFDTGNWNDVLNVLQKIGFVVTEAVTALLVYKATLIAIVAIDAISKIAGMVGAFISLIPEIHSVKDAMTLLNLAFNANPIAIIVTAIAMLVAGFIYLWNTSESFRNFWIGLWNGIKNTFQAIWNGIIGFFTDTIPTAFNNLVNSIGNAINSVLSWFYELPGNIWNALTSALETIGNWINDIRNIMSNGIHNIIDSVIEWFYELPGRLVDVGRNIVEGLWNGINNATDWILDKIRGFKDAVLNGIKSFFGIHSPSTLMRDEIGRYIPEGIAVGIDANTDSALNSIDNMNDSILSKMKQAVNAETGSINATASVKSNNSMLNVIQANFAVDGSVNIDGQKAGRIMTPSIVKTLRLAGAS